MPDHRRLVLMEIFETEKIYIKVKRKEEREERGKEREEGSG